MSYEFFDEDEKNTYNENYVEALQGLTNGLEQDEIEQVWDELSTMRYDPTDNAKQDAEINFLKAEKKAKEKNQVTNPHTKSYIRYIQQTRGLSNAEIRKMMRKGG